MQIGVLGPLQLIGEHGPLPIGAPRVRRLLARLCVDAGRTVDRELLSEALWPDGALPRRPDKSLQDTVSDLRHALEPVPGGFLVETRATGYRLDLGGGSLDSSLAADLASAAERALVAADLERATGTADDVLRLYRGHPYEEFEHDEFAQPEIVRLEMLFWDATETRCVAAAARSDRRALLDLPALVQQQPLRSRLWAAWMVLLARLGRDAEALQVFTAARTTLLELGLDPPQLLVQLEHAVLDQRDDIGAGVLFATAGDARPATVRAAAPVRLPEALDRPGRLPLVDRDDELAVLLDAWHGCEHGRSAAVLIEGESGIGKTRLVAELARRVADAGGVVFAAACSASLAAPFQPFADIAPDWFATIGEPVGDGSGDPGGADFRQVYRSLVTWLGERSTDRPVLLVIEDLHWATSSTAALLERVLASTELSGLLTVVSARTEELAVAHPCNAVVARFAGGSAGGAVGGRMHRVTLRGLALSGIEELVKAHGSDHDPRHLHDVTAGNALFVESLLLDQPDADADADTDTRDRAGRAAAPGTPARVGEAVGRRLERLSPDDLQVLSVASVVGREFELRLIEALAEPGQHRAALLDCMERCVRLGLVHERGHEPGRFAFVHDLVRSVLYDRMLAARRADRHYRIATALERIGRVPAAVLAHHHASAGALGDLARTSAVLSDAGREALERGGADEACRYVERSLDIAIDRDDAALAELQLLYSRSLKATGAIRAAKRAAERTAAHARAAGRQDLFVAALTEHSTYGNGWLTDDRSISLAHDALAWLDPGPSALRARTMARLAYHRSFWGAPDATVERAAREAVAMAAALHDRSAEETALRALAQAVGKVGTPAERIAIGERLVSIGDDGAEPTVAAHGWRTRALAAYELGDQPTLEASLTALAATARHTSWIFAADVQRLRCLQALSLGDWTAAADANQAYRSMIPDDLFYRMGAELQRCWLERELGRPCAIDASLRATSEALPAAIGVGLSCVDAVLAAEAGHRDDARALLAAASAQPAFGEMSPVHGVTHALIVTAAVAAGAHEYLERSCAALAPYGTQIVTTAWGEIGMGSSASVRGAGLAALGRHDEAVTLLRAGLDVEERASFHTFSVRTLHDLVRTAHAAGVGAAQLEEWERRGGHLLESLGTGARPARPA